MHVRPDSDTWYRSVDTLPSILRVTGICHDRTSVDNGILGLGALLYTNSSQLGKTNGPFSD